MTSLISPVFMFFATIAGRCTGVDVRIVGCASSILVDDPTTSNGLAVFVVDDVEGGGVDSFPSVENIRRWVGCGIYTLEVDDAVNAYDDDTIIANRARIHRCIMLYTLDISLRGLSLDVWQRFTWCLLLVDVVPKILGANYRAFNFNFKVTLKT